MRAPIVQRNDLAGVIAVQHNGQADERTRKHLADLDFIAERRDVPCVHQKSHTRLPTTSLFVKMRRTTGFIDMPPYSTH
jgi:hypothetical protein